LSGGKLAADWVRKRKKINTQLQNNPGDLFKEKKTRGEAKREKRSKTTIVSYACHAAAMYNFRKAETLPHKFSRNNGSQ